MAVGRDGQNLIGAERDESGSRDSSVNERYPHALHSRHDRAAALRQNAVICVPPRPIVEEPIADQNGGS
jgi:hypothetical protein